MNFLYIPAQYQLRSASAVTKCVDAPHTVLVKTTRTESLLDITTLVIKLAKQGRPVHGIIISDPVLLKLYAKSNFNTSVVDKSEATLDNYQGCMFNHNAVTVSGTKYTIPVVVIQNPEHITYSGASEHLARRFISKLYDRSWVSAPTMTWQLGVESALPELYTLFSSPKVALIALDIETMPLEVPFEVAKLASIKGVSTEGIWFEGYAKTKGGAKAKRLITQAPIITCVGYTAIIIGDDGAATSHTVVIPMVSEQARRWVVKFNSLPAPKVLTNGRYDSLYLLRYDAPIYNYAFDLYLMMHSWQVELPRGLANIASYTLRNSMYWKDEAGSDLYLYNAKDCHQTAWACFAMLQLMPDWAINNFTSYFKLTFPCITCELEGFKQDEEECRTIWKTYNQQITEDTNWWNTVVANHFNINSPKQVLQLFRDVLRTGVKSTNKNDLTNIQHKHPLWRLMVDKLLTSRESRKADSTYLNITLFSGRILYGLDPAGTTSGRLASKASGFWCGNQIQNQPPYVKSMYVADGGWELNAIDNSQSESRTTAYIVGDVALIDAVENAPDFHTRNASMFFGIEEAELLRKKKSSDPAEVALFKTIRNEIGKRVNHGANYNMMEQVLIQTMTPDVIIKAKHALKLPGHYTLTQVATHLLECFDRAYPKIRSKQQGGYHYAIIEEVRTTGKLVNPNGWTRSTFLRPWESKMDVNALVAHKPQGWSVQSINAAFYDAWYQYQIVENVCRFKAQVHDELIFQTRPENTTHVVQGVSALMKRPNKFTAATSGLGVDGEMVIPNDPKFGKYRWSELKD